MTAIHPSPRAFVCLLLVLAICLPLTSFAVAQTIEEQVEKQTMPQRMRNMLVQVKLDKMPAEDAFKWWRANSRIPLVINWDQLADDGISPTTPITLDLELVPCHQVLRLITQQTSPARPMVIEITPWYVEVMSKLTANERLTTRTYRVRDLLWSINDRVPAKDDDDSGDDDRDRRSSRTRSTQVKADDLVDVIRASIEPDIWKENGGKSSIVYHDGRIIVRAPVYVHNQIDMPEVSKPVPHTAPTREADEKPADKAD